MSTSNLPGPAVTSGQDISKEPNTKDDKCDSTVRNMSFDDVSENQFFRRGEELYEYVNDIASHMINDESLLRQLERTPSMESTNSLASVEQNSKEFGPIEPLDIDASMGSAKVAASDMDESPSKKIVDREKLKAFGAANERAKKCTRTYAVWSQEERELVLQALLERTRQLMADASADDLQRYLIDDKKGGSKRKRQTDLDIISEKLPHKTSSQVRDYYYRTLKQIDKLLKQVDYSHDLTNPEGARIALLFYHHHLGRAHVDFGLHCRQKGDRKAAADFMAISLRDSLKAHKKNITTGNIDEFLNFLNSGIDSKASSSGGQSSTPAQANATTVKLRIQNPEKITKEKPGGSLGAKSTRNVAANSPSSRKQATIPKPISQRRQPQKRHVSTGEMVEILPPFSPLKKQKQKHELEADLLEMSLLSAEDQTELLEAPGLELASLFENRAWQDSMNGWFEHDVA